MDFHPLLTIVSGLPTHVRQHLTATVAGLPSGMTPEATGELEVHGILMDLTKENYNLLDLNQEMDVVLRRADLPGAEPEPLQIAEPQPGSGPTAAITQELEQIEASFAALTRTIDRLQEQLRSTVNERQQVATQLESLPTASPERLAEEREHLKTRLDAAIAAIGESSEFSDHRRSIELRINELIGTSEQLKQDMKHLERLDPTSVRQAFRALEMSAGSSAPDPRALALADELDRVAESVVMAMSRQAGARSQVAELSARRDQAHQEFLVAQAAVSSPAVDESVIEELESVHDQIFELDGRSAKAAGGKGRRRLEELKQRESQLLGSLGFDTWSSYVMGQVDMGAGEVAEHRLAAAKAGLALAEEELAKARRMTVPDDPELVRLRTLQHQLLGEAGRILGHAPAADASVELRSVRVTQQSPTGMRVEDAAAALRLALQDAGTAVPARSISVEELKGIASNWLESVRDLDDRVSAVRAQRTAVEQEISALGEQFEHLELSVQRAAATPEIQQMRDRLGQYNRAIEQAQGSAQQRVELEQRQHRLSDAERDLRSALSEREAAATRLNDQRADAQSRLRYAEQAETNRGYSGQSQFGAASTASDSAGVEAVEWYVLARLAQQRSVSFVGSVPLVIDDAFVDWRFEDIEDIFTRLERMSEVIQIIYLTEDPSIIRWGQRLGAGAKIISPR